MNVLQLALVAISTIVAATNAQSFNLPPVVDCGSVSQANDIAMRYPMNATGVLNGTLAMLPISMDLARSLIPAKYQILTNAIRDLLPGFPSDTYPALLQIMHDHDVRYGPMKMNDFQRASIEFPFVDLLGDGSTSFRWGSTMFISGTNMIGIGAIAEYGTIAFPSAFAPSCNAFDEVTPGTWTFRASGTNTTANCEDGKPCLTTSFTQDPAPDMRIADYFVNATNQPSFGKGTVCDNQIRLFNASEWTHTPVIGDIYADGAFGIAAGQRNSGGVWNGVKGFHAPSRFIENNYIPCEQLRGYGPDTIQKLLTWTPPVTTQAAMQIRAEDSVSLENSIVANSTLPEPSPAPLSLTQMMAGYLMAPAKLLSG
jgi:hypothetical protein